MGSEKYEEQGMLMLHENIKKEIDIMSNEMVAAKELVNKLNNNDFWEGKGFDSYNKKFNALFSNFEAFCNDLYTLTNNIKSSLERYKETEQQLKRN